MSADTTYPIPVRVGTDGVHYAQTMCTPTDDTNRPQCCVPPWTVVPVVFVPGIMGSNLKAKEDISLNGQRIFKKGARVWNVDSLTSPKSWWGKGSAFRQAAFDHAAVMVDNSGRILYGTSEETAGTKALARASGGTMPLANIDLAEAKKRGWGTASSEYYGSFLHWLQYQLSAGRLVNGKPNGVFLRFMALAKAQPPHDKQRSPSKLTDAQIRKMLDIHFPVYAVGYNWLQSNMDSGLDLMKGVGTGDGHVMGIDEIIKRYDGVNGQTCKQVIVVTHSMGGLVARAAALAHGGEGKMLGIVHGVQPIDGAAAFYKRLAAGFEGEGWGVPWVTSQILGPTSKDTIPELAYNPGPLELAPNKRYNGGRPWLFIKDRNGKVLKALPERGDPYEEIYLDTGGSKDPRDWCKHVWRAVNPEWLDPAQMFDDGSAGFTFEKAVKKARDYHTKLGGKLHPKTYAHWGADPKYKSWGDMTWNAELGVTWTMPAGGEFSAGAGAEQQNWVPDRKYMPTDPGKWSFKTPVTSAGVQRDLLSADNKEIRMTVVSAADAGDGTVPAAASGARIANYPGCQIGCALTGFDHQGDYDNETVRDVLLDALVRLVEPVKVDECA